MMCIEVYKALTFVPALPEDAVEFCGILRARTILIQCLSGWHCEVVWQRWDRRRRCISSAVPARLPPLGRIRGTIPKCLADRIVGNANAIRFAVFKPDHEEREKKSRREDLLLDLMSRKSVSRGIFSFLWLIEKPLCEMGKKINYLRTAS